MSRFKIKVHIKPGSDGAEVLRLLTGIKGADGKEYRLKDLPRLIRANMKTQYGTGGSARLLQKFSLPMEQGGYFANVESMFYWSITPQGEKFWGQVSWVTTIEVLQK